MSEVVEQTHVDLDDKMLTTVDNPYSPKTEYYEWSLFDRENGWYTEEYIARLVSMEEDFDVDDEFMMNMLTNKVIDEILRLDDQDVYRLV